MLILEVTVAVFIIYKTIVIFVIDTDISSDGIHY